MNSDLVKLARRHLDGKTPHEAVNSFDREITNKQNAHLRQAAFLFVLQTVAERKSVGQFAREFHALPADASGASGHNLDATHPGFAGGASSSKTSVGQSGSDTQTSRADVRASGHLKSETHAEGAGGASSSKPKAKRPWKAPPPRTPEQRAGTLETTSKIVTRSVFDSYRIGHQPIGNFRYRELSAVMSQCATEAASTLNSGLKKTVDAVLFRRLRDYARPPSDDTMVRDMVPAQKLTEMINESDAEARQLVAYGVKGQRHIIENPWEVLSTPTN
jgi:hypothetical protein